MTSISRIIDLWLLTAALPMISSVRDCCAVLFSSQHEYNGGRDGSVGIATRYGLDGPGIESLWAARFSAPVQTFPGVHPASCTMGTGSFQGVKRPGRGADHPPPSKCRGLKLGRAIPLPTLRVLVACIRGTFTYLLTSNTQLKIIHKVST